MYKYNLLSPFGVVLTHVFRDDHLRLELCLSSLEKVDSHFLSRYFFPLAFIERQSTIRLPPFMLYCQLVLPSLRSDLGSSTVDILCVWLHYIVSKIYSPIADFLILWLLQSFFPLFSNVL